MVSARGKHAPEIALDMSADKLQDIWCVKEQASERAREEKVGNITGGTGDEHRRSETLNLPFRPILMCVCVYGNTADGLLIQDHPMQKRTNVST